MTLARPGQILLSAVAEPLAHRAARELGERGEQLLWKSFGRWCFKGINDEHGHLVGDRVLQGVANILRSAAGPDDIACRFGGDEFCLLVKAGHKSDLEQMAHFVLGTARALLALQPTPPQITTLSIGASLATPAQGWDDWYAQADAALYRAKRLGGDRVEWDGDDALASA
jgi:diguanylate cyclase (GGDEF)-like protein